MKKAVKRIFVGSLLMVLVLGFLGGSLHGAQEVVVCTSEDQVFFEPILKALERAGLSSARPLSVGGSSTSMSGADS